MSEVKYNIRPLQEQILKIFKVFAAICEKHGLRYYAAYGTALGAIRHHGFIPWDDDFDVAMPRSDYNQFVKIVQQELPQGLVFLRGGDAPNSPIYFSKIVNGEDELPAKLSRITNMTIEDPPFIDIFVLENIPQCILDLKQWWRKRRLWRFCQLWRYPETARCASRKGVTLLFARLLGFLLNYHYRKTADNTDMMYVLDEISSILPNSEHIIEPCFFRMRESRLLSVSDFEPARTVEFEDTKINVPSRVERLLRIHYGDFMTLPPIDQRIPEHAMRKTFSHV